MNVLGHCCYIGKTGYAIHSRYFFRALSKKLNLKIRNYSIDEGWRGMDCENPHSSSVNELDKQILALQTCDSSQGSIDVPIYNGISNFQSDFDIVLVDCFHPYYNHNYSGKKIFFNVWEKTRYSDDFFNKLQSAYQVWVPTQWQKDCLIQQGLDCNKIKIVPEGIDTEELYPNLERKYDKFTFLILGKWEKRKSTEELIKAYVELFGSNPNVQLLLSCSNNFPDDHFNSTKARLENIGIQHENIKIIDFQSRADLIKMIQSSHVFLSCARSEGWNLPLIESMACGIPAIYSNCAGQLEFAKGYGIPINVFGEINNENDPLNGYYAPDYNDLKNKMLEVYHSYSFYKQKALSDSEEIRKIYTWDRAASIAVDHLLEREEKKQINIVNSSNSLGDFLAWTPIVSRYSKEKNIIVNFFTPYKTILESSYPNIKFFPYEQAFQNGNPIDFNLGCFNEKVWRKQNIQEIACSILNLNYQEEKCEIKFTSSNRKYPNKYVCIATQSTSQFKYWNNDIGWKQTVIYLKNLGFDVVCIDKYSSFGAEAKMNYIPEGCIDDTGDKPIEDRIDTILNCEFFIGLGSGLSWLAWACNKPVVMIAGFSSPKTEFFTKYRVHNNQVCNSCWNDDSFAFDKNNWMWCPRNKNFECSSEISFDMVKDKIDECIKDNNLQINKNSIEISQEPKILINFVSDALGDNIAHSPYPDLYQKKNGGLIYVSSKWANIFKSDNPKVKFIDKQTSLYFDKQIDVFYKQGDCPIQESICKDLELSYEPVLPLINDDVKYNLNKKRKYVCISVHSTAQMKYWNNQIGWRKTVSYLKDLGYDVYCIDRYFKYGTQKFFNEPPSNAIDETGDKPIEYRIAQLKNCDFFIGLSSGLAWLAWALKKKTIVISGVTMPNKEFFTPYRIINNAVCHGCLSKQDFLLSDKPWEYCPENKNFECTKSITFDMVKQQIDSLIKDMSCNL